MNFKKNQIEVERGPVQQEYEYTNYFLVDWSSTQYLVFMA